MATRLSLTTPLIELPAYLRRMGAATAGRLAAELAAAVGKASPAAVTVEDLLFYLPFRYEDRSHLPRIRDLTDGMAASVAVEVHAPASVPIRTKNGKRLTLFEFTGRDETGRIRAYWWNQPYLRQTFPAERRVILYGEWRFSNRHQCHQVENPEYELLSDETDADAPETIHVGRCVPVYRRLGQFRARALRTLMFRVLEALGDLPDDGLPDELRAGDGACGPLPTKVAALRAAHFPGAGANLAEMEARRSPAHARLALEEFFLLTLALGDRRRRREEAGAKATMAITDAVRARVQRALPFPMTQAQKRVIREIVNDMTGVRPMSRLLQGDVGSGKTIIALQALMVAVENGWQAALMAPTEILAEQHYRSLTRWLEGMPYRLAALTGRLKASEKKAIRQALAARELDVIIGTQALIQEDTTFARLGLVVIDEQHRFGVMQREKLVARGVAPDVLVMTATPIPRSLAMAVYGDLDVSVIDELPPGRKPVATAVRGNDRRARVYDFIRQECAAGRQAYIVYPLVEESEKLDVAAATAAAEYLQREVFPTFAVSLLHGRLRADEKDAVMQRFVAGDIQILVTTTVIEVGIDVPNASVMVIEHPERFGLAQLHQLRGRVGRGAAKSYCVLMTPDGISPEALERLTFFAETLDGFAIAEKDLLWRGPGEMLGARQSGMPTFRVGDIVRDADWLAAARQIARRILREKPNDPQTLSWLDQARRLFPLAVGGVH
ncbi:MAG: ATP-dependent DNA helicase RecG [Chloracidobacterium sp. CP2_5A]|nr:MAG: ATP-dependent DNA helicase RecG [Chloracidobacterium sp. CP2_5A]